MYTRAAIDRPLPTQWFTRARGVAGAYFSLAVADLAMARAAGCEAVAAGALAMMFGVTAWGVLVAAAVVALVNAGLSWPWALLLLGAVSAGLAALCVLRVKAVLPFARMDATRRQLDRLFNESADAKVDRPDEIL